MSTLAKYMLNTMLKIPFKMIGNFFCVKSTVNWSKEKKDILQRANWLCDEVLVSPELLIDKMPHELGEHYQGEWAIYTCSHLSAALVNISHLYPEEKQTCAKRAKQLVEMVLSPAIREYDTKSWGEDALQTLKGEKSHMTYLSILAWVITNYKMIDDNNQYDKLLEEICETLHRRMLKAKYMNLPSFPNGIVFLPDMMFAIVALNNFAKFNNGKYADTVNRWLDSTRENLIDSKTELIVSFQDRKVVRGSYVALNCYCLTLLDNKQFSQQQYIQMKKFFKKNYPSWGIREHLNKTPLLAFDPDAGPIAFGLSPSGTAWAIGSATYFQDWKFRNQLLRTAEIAGNTTQRKNKRHYKLGELAMVGEAVVLAMKTNVDKN